MKDMERFQRQIQLPQIGRVGQERLLSGHLDLENALDSKIREAAVRYALAAGMGTVHQCDEGLGEKDLPPSFTEQFRYAPSRAIGLGAALVISASLPLFSADPTRKGAT